MATKVPWPNPVLIFKTKGAYLQFHSLHNLVLIREVVSDISMQQMVALQGMNKRFKAKLMAYPFVIVLGDTSATAYSPDGASQPVDLDALPLLDAEVHMDEDLLLVNCASTLAVYGQRDRHAFRFRMQDLVMSSIMCMPRRLDGRDIPFLIERRRGYAEKQLANSRIVLQSDNNTLSLYDTTNFALVKTIYRDAS
jgi:hypothetical protein